MLFADALSRPLFHYLRDTHAEASTSLPLPLGVYPSPTALDLDALRAAVIGPPFERLSPGDRRSLTPEDLPGVVTLDVGFSDPLAKLTELPNLQRVNYTLGDTATLPDTVARLPRLRMLQLTQGRRADLGPNPLSAIPETLRHASRLEALDLELLHALTDISLLVDLPKLRHVRLYNTTALRDYAGLHELPRLQSLTLESIDLDRAADVLPTLTGLTTLDLKSSLRRSTVPLLAETLAGMPALRGLSLRSGTLGDGLPPLTELRQLNLYSIDELPPGLLATATSLEVLSLEFWCEAALPDGIDALTELRALDLSFSSLTDDTDAGALTALTHLEILDLSQQQALTRVPEAVGALPRLRQLSLAGHRIRDISALRGHPSLSSADLSGVQDQAHLVDVVMSMPALERVEVSKAIDINPLADHPTLRFVTSGGVSAATAGERFDVHKRVAYVRR